MAVNNNFKSSWRYSSVKTYVDNYRDLHSCLLEQLMTESGLTPTTGGLTNTAVKAIFSGLQNLGIITAYEKSKLDQLTDAVTDSNSAMEGQSEAQRLGLEFEKDPNLSDIVVTSAGIVASSFGMQINAIGGSGGDLEFGTILTDLATGVNTGLVIGGLTANPALGVAAGMMGAAYGSSYSLCKKFYGW